MKKYFTFMLAAVFLSVGLVGCGKDDSGPKTDKEKDEAVKESLVGKWQRVGFEVAEYKDGKFVKITDEGIIEEFQSEMPRFVEMTMSKFVMLMSPNSDNSEERMEMTYTLDAKTNTIVLIEGPRDDGWDSDIVNANYVLSGDKNNLTLILVFEEDVNGDGVGDKFQQTIKLKRIANWPAG